MYGSPTYRVREESPRVATRPMKRGKTTLDQVNEWLGVRTETEGLEFKEAKNQLDFKKLLEYCVGIGNEGGGQLVLGVTNECPRRVVGSAALDNPQKAAEKMLDRLGFRVHVEEVQHPDGRVVVVHIPSRPVGVALHLDGKYLMRCGEQLVPMSQDVLRVILNEGQEDFILDVAKARLSDEATVEILDTHVYFELMEEPYPERRGLVLRRFEKEGLIRAGGGGISITNLGALLFAQRLQDFDQLAWKSPRLIRYDGVSKDQTARDIVGVRGYAVGFSNFVGSIENMTPSNEVIEEALRIENKVFPVRSVRELVANALIHQDLTLGGTRVTVEIYNDRLEVTNPGKPDIPTERFIDEYGTRNERLADLMRRLRICEAKGSGIDRVVRTAEAMQLPAPEFRATERRTTAILYAHRPFSEMDKFDRVRACYQHCCLQYITRAKMTNATLRDRFGFGGGAREITAVSRVLADTRELELIRLGDNTASKKNAHYVPFWA